jgi:16S rRNA (adenine1518-N6/adenine1519-N6)-dimethyltransferase
MYVKPKKSLGQNFLIDKNIQNKIVNACNLESADTVLEIGAGRGELTQLIANVVHRVHALEVDHYLCSILKDNLKKNKNVNVINRDILKFNLNRYFAKSKNKIKVIGNLPYYITTPIIEHLLEYRDKIGTIFITVQREFAQRMSAHAGSKEYGSFSCFLQYYSEAKKLFVIRNTCFRPIPKVDSTLLRLDIRKEPPVKIKNEEILFKIIRAAFNKRRKTLRNSLKEVIPPRNLEKFFQKFGIDVNIRPESLTLEDFANLSNI